MRMNQKHKAVGFNSQEALKSPKALEPDGSHLYPYPLHLARVLRLHKVIYNFIY